MVGDHADECSAVIFGGIGLIPRASEFTRHEKEPK